ncbi:glycosyltransferase [Moraxella sp. ZJ142]|uniref:glycosyltransferase n=1 Tax=Moraxella marmotae TaxID=3344520 RepID=UPI0035D47121
MTNMDKVTLCLTIGKRPKELAQTLNSLINQLKFQHIIAINDFGDEATNQVFIEKCPQGQLINLGYNLGHHKAIDYMYQQVKTPYIFHCEDDWLFDSQPDIAKAIQILETHPQISCIGFRKTDDFLYTPEQRDAVKALGDDLVGYVRVDHLHEQWHGYSFNPHLAKTALWQRHQPFANFKKERHISRFLRKQGMHMLFLEQGNCHHIGHESVSNPPKKTLWQKLKFW